MNAYESCRAVVFMLGFALFLANLDQLRHVHFAWEALDFRVFSLLLIVSSVALLMVVFVLLGLLGSREMDGPNEREGRADFATRGFVFAAWALLVVNVFVFAFSAEVALEAWLEAHLAQFKESAMRRADQEFKNQMEMLDGLKKRIELQCQA